MKLTEENVLIAEHQMIQETLIWETMGDKDTMAEVLMYISGINEMAQKIIEVMRELKNQ